MDAGCGTGRITKLILNKVPRGRVIAVDRSLNMIDSARRYLEPFGDRVEFLPADLQELAYPEPVDCIFSNYVLQFVSDHSAVYERFAQCLRPGALLAIQFPCSSAARSPLFQAVAAVCARPQFAAEVGDEVEFLRGGGASRARSLLASHGFKVHACWTKMRCISHEAPANLESWLRTIPLRGCLSRIRSSATAEFVRAVCDELRTRQADLRTPFETLFAIAEQQMLQS